ncbi:uncharacterized protein LOC124923687 [Impatiens glandulifera]|uniref:uncharacterized protein LOC124923687 n=1 Tax=Impatiens glandulifera TaxID=253017 RepID=UPI001FB0B7AF|nr:uncharacterized protein LOC124923687 [Impatiens glandulifera]
MIRSFFIIFLIINYFLLLLSLGGDARKGPLSSSENYWKLVMKGEAMPKPIEELIVIEDDGQSAHHDFSSSSSSSSSSNSGSGSYDASVGRSFNMDQFTRDFDIKPNVIIYHKHVR